MGIIFNNINNLSFNGMKDRLWSGVDYPMNDISFRDKDVLSYKIRLSRGNFEEVVQYMPENSCCCSRCLTAPWSNSLSVNLSHIA